VKYCFILCKRLEKTNIIGGNPASRCKCCAKFFISLNRHCLSVCCRVISLETKCKRSVNCDRTRRWQVRHSALQCRLLPRKVLSEP
jgi:hypothetical protein